MIIETTESVAGLPPEIFRGRAVSVVSATDTNAGGSTILQEGRKRQRKTCGNNGVGSRGHDSAVSRKDRACGAQQSILSGSRLGKTKPKAEVDVFPCGAAELHKPCDEERSVSLRDVGIVYKGVAWIRAWRHRGCAGGGAGGVLGRRASTRLKSGGL